MEREFIEIRSNISPALERIDQLVREREEREKSEREAKWAREREEREKLSNEWKALHPILDKFTYMSYYNYETYSWQGDYYNVKFYEWSNIDSEPRHFPYSIAFYRFLDECKLNLTDALNNKIKACKSGCFITCIPGTHDLLVADSYESLRNQYNIAVSTNRVLEDVPDIMDKSNDNTMGPTNPNNLPAIANKPFVIYDDD